ncbi:regulatory protein RecX [Jonesia quinghaiensis]|uniref:regulatory protein RecX n=1 Tax=Jonesia quinghaiensis TaxID=262806 RepID=UPI0003FAEB3A|nr:regulatory protein RecX [Jonesia quinghaiensis]
MPTVDYDDLDIPEESRLRVDPDLERARSVALRILSAGPRSRADLTERLRGRDINEEVIFELLEGFERVGLIDDTEYAKAVARTRFAERGRARRAIAQELSRKQLSDEDIADAVSQISDEAEYSTALELARKRLARDSSGDITARKRRVAGYLGRRGYSPGVVMSCISTALAEEQNADSHRHA